MDATFSWIGVLLVGSRSSPILVTRRDSNRGYEYLFASTEPFGLLAESRILQFGNGRGDRRDAHQRRLSGGRDDHHAGGVGLVRFGSSTYSATEGGSVTVTVELSAVLRRWADRPIDAHLRWLWLDADVEGLVLLDPRTRGAPAPLWIGVEGPRERGGGP